MGGLDLYGYIIFRYQVYGKAYSSNKHVSWPWLSPLRGCGSLLSPLRGCGSLTMSLAGKFVYIWLTISSCYGSIPLTLGLIGRDGGLSTLCHSCGLACCLSAGGTKNVSWPWLSPLRGWGCLTMSLIGKFVCVSLYVCVYIYI